MTCEEIFSSLTNHMIKGLMVHEQFANYYDFLGLPAYRKCHEKHYYEENKSYRKIYHHYITTHNKLLPEIKFESPQVIPSTWLQYTRQEVDVKTKQLAIKQGLELWIQWEKDTLMLYEQLYKNLLDISCIASAEKVKCLIIDVQKELKEAEQYHLNKISTNYDMTLIIEEQKYC